MERTCSNLEKSIVADLTIELRTDPAFNADVLTAKVRNAIREVRVRRNYGASSYSEAAIVEDLEEYYPVILNVARYDYNTVGAEGEDSHSENGTSRVYTDREKLFRCVHAFVKIF